MNALNVFDGERSEKLKREGMEKAADSAADWLKMARIAAKKLTKTALNGHVHADMVMLYMNAVYGIDSLGPAAGSLFKTKDWEWTGEFVKSKRITNHSRLLRVWRLKQ